MENVLNTEYVRKLLDEKCMTQEQLAQAATDKVDGGAVSSRTIQRALAGEPLRVSTIKAIADALGVEVRKIRKGSLVPDGPRAMVPVILNDAFLRKPEKDWEVELWEVIAIRQVDGDAKVLGYAADLDELVIFNLLQYGGYSDFEKWGSLGDDVIYKFDPALGMAIGGGDAPPQVCIGRSGCRLKFGVLEARPDDTYENSGLIRVPPDGE